MHRRRATPPSTPRVLPARPSTGVDHRPEAGDELEWSWPPYAPVEEEVASFDTLEWAPPSVVWHPQLRLGRWTVLYRRAA